MKFLKTLLFGLGLAALSSCEKPQTQNENSEKKEPNTQQTESPKTADPEINQTTEFVLRLSNNMGKHTVAEGCEIDFYADTRGTLWLGLTMNGVSEGTSIDLDPNELVSFYWEKGESTLWTITPTKLCKSTCSELSSSSTARDYTKKSLPNALDELNSPETVRAITQHYLAQKDVTALSGLHLKNIFGQHSLGNQIINCYLDTRGTVWLGTGSGGRALKNSERKEISMYYNSDTQQIWMLTSNSFYINDLENKRNSNYSLSAKALQRREAPAKVIELAKEINPSI